MVVIYEAFSFSTQSLILASNNIFEKVSSVEVFFSAWTSTLFKILRDAMYLYKCYASFDCSFVLGDPCAASRAKNDDVAIFELKMLQ